MRLRQAVQIVAITVAAGCATVHQAPIQAPSLDGVTTVTGRMGVGHVCPFAPTLAFTAEHISGWHSPSDYWKNAARVPLITELDGDPVSVLEYRADRRRDLSLVKILTPGYTWPRVYKVAQDPPEPGDKIYLRGFDVMEGFEVVDMEAKVLAVTHGVVYYSDSPGRGSSGSCVLNQDGEIVAINTHLYGIPAAPGRKARRMGAGFLVAGAWEHFEEAFQE